MQLLPGQEPVRAPHPARHVFSIVGLIAWVIFIMGGFFAAAYYVTSILSGGNMAAVISAALVELANEDRLEENLGTLSVNPLLTLAAQMKANDMAQKGYFSHATPEGLQPWHFIREAGYEYATAGENLAVNFSDSENVEEAWMNSPTHRANILNAKFTEVGIATAVGDYQGRRTTFVVQMFGAPKTSATVTPVETVTLEAPEELAVTVTEEAPQILGSEADAPSEDRGDVSIASTPSLGIFSKLLASPENLLRALFLVSGLVVLIALALTTRLELRRHHMRHVVAATFLLLLMGGTLILADAVIFTEPVITEAAEKVVP